MKNKKIVFMVTGVFLFTLLILGVFFMPDGKNNNESKVNLKEDKDYPDEHLFKTCDEVVLFMSNLYNSKDVEIISENDGVCDIVAKVDEEFTYKYRFDTNTRLLSSLD